MRVRFLTLLGLTIFGFELHSNAAELSVLTFNLHGYHPMGERERVFEDRAGLRTRAPSDIYFFTWDEIVSGHEKRLNELSQRLGSVRPDLVFLQEVGAGAPDSKHDCTDFTRVFQEENAAENTALRLVRRLRSQGISYQALLACRGNSGWVTSANTFSERRVLAADAIHERGHSVRSAEVVYDFGANPYPRGIIVEGNAILAGTSIRVISSQGVHVPVAAGKEDHFFQAVVFETKLAPGRTLAINVHMGHKLRNFEHAVAIRNWVESTKLKLGIDRVLIGGDFNETASGRLSDHREATLTMMPFEIYSRGLFDLRLPADSAKRNEWIAKIATRLNAINFLPDYKAFATIRNPSEVRARIDSAIASFLPLWQEAKDPVPAFEESRASAQLCRPFSSWRGACDYRSRIDYWFSSASLQATEFSIFESDADYYRTDRLSDHPAVFTRYRYRSN